jgi:hypothetical protein
LKGSAASVARCAASMLGVAGFWSMSASPPP